MIDERTCYFCGRKIPVKDEWLTLLGRLMCSSCERQLVKTSVDDDSYLIFKEKIKNLWFN